MSYITTHITIQSKVIKLSEATREELIEWINSAENSIQRNLRKQICHARLYTPYNNYTLLAEDIKQYSQELNLFEGG